jgi:lysophospholipase L1-like esterase
MPARRHALLLILLTLRILAVPGEPPSSPSPLAPLYVVGDSISAPPTWPRELARLTGRDIFSQAIGGSRSPAMLARARGVELVSPPAEASELPPGPVVLRWRRHLADRSHEPAKRAEWPALVRQVSEPLAIELLLGGRPAGAATRVLLPAASDHARAPRTVRSPGHGLATGYRVAFLSPAPVPLTPGNVLPSPAPGSANTPGLPSALVERRVYFVAQATPDTLELREFVDSPDTLDLGGDFAPGARVECGWTVTVDHPGGPWRLDWRARTAFDARVWLLEVSANDIPAYPAAEVTLPNIERLLAQMSETAPRYLLITPPLRHQADSGPGTKVWNNYHETYLPALRARYPARVLELMPLLEARRTARELAFLTDPPPPALLWLSGRPDEEATWNATAEARPGAHQMWVGPGYIPLQFRVSFSDTIHLNTAANRLLAARLRDELAARGW